ncbi:MAG: type II toxin-antitoxin system Phd/YefM family antitoxin [Chloroflexi bacterium]|nr:type II toxin-antitoxin system Phd/YefM family antitoxin [Chloroflexota bacterium]
MEKTVAAFEARRQFGKILTDVLTRGDRFVVERHGEPVAAVVPIEVYEQWKKARSAFFARARAAAEQANLPPDEADRLAAEAVRAVRAATTP